MVKRKRTTVARRRRRSRFAVRKRRRRMRRRPLRIPRPLSGFPQTKVVRLRYVEQFTLDPATGGVALQDFRCNSIYDPNASGTGHQPYGHDQWAQYYRRYEVLKSSIRVDYCQSEASASTSVLVVGIEVDDATTVTTDPILQLEQGRTRHKILHTGGSSKGLRSVRAGWNMRRYLKDTGKVSRADNIAYFGASPVLVQRYHVMATAIASLQNPTGIFCTAYITYTVRLSEVNDFLQS